MSSIEVAKQRYQEIVEKAISKKPKVEVPKPTNPQQPKSIKQLTAGDCENESERMGGT